MVGEQMQRKGNTGKKGGGAFLLENLELSNWKGTNYLKGEMERFIRPHRKFLPQLVSECFSCIQPNTWSKSTLKAGWCISWPRVNAPQFSRLGFFKLVLRQTPFLQINNSSTAVIPRNNSVTCWVYPDPLNPFFLVWDNTGRCHRWFVPLETETWDYSIKGCAAQELL